MSHETIEKKNTEKESAETGKQNIDLLREKINIALNNKEATSLKEEDIVNEALMMVKGNKELEEKFRERFASNRSQGQVSGVDYENTEGAAEDAEIELLEKIAREKSEILNGYKNAQVEAHKTLADEDISQADKADIQELVDSIEESIKKDEESLVELNGVLQQKRNDKSRAYTRRRGFIENQTVASLEPVDFAVKSVIEAYQHSGQPIDMKGKSEKEFEQELRKKVSGELAEMEQKNRQEEAELNLDKWLIKSEVLYNKFKTEFENELAGVEGEFNTLVSDEKVGNGKLTELKNNKMHEERKVGSFRSKIFGADKNKLGETEKNLEHIHSERWRLIQDLESKSIESVDKLKSIMEEIYEPIGSGSKKFGEDVLECHNLYKMSRGSASHEKRNECDEVAEKAQQKLAELIQKQKDLFSKMKAFANEAKS